MSVMFKSDWSILNAYTLFIEFIDALHVIPQGEQNPNDDKDCLSWWFSGENPSYFSSKHVSDYVKGFDETINQIKEVFKTKVCRGNLYFTA